jgi:O-antigen/teichoic acid export membrane protein
MEVCDGRLALQRLIMLVSLTGMTLPVNGRKYSCAPRKNVAPSFSSQHLEKSLPAHGGTTVKRTSTVVRYGGFFLSLGTARALGLAITSFTFPVLVRRLGVQTYGRWSYVVALCAFFDVVANPGLTTHMAQQVAARRHAAAELVCDFLVLRVLSSVVAMIALMVVAVFEVRPEIRWLLRFYGVAELCVGLTGPDFILSSLELFHFRAVMTLFQQSLYAAGVLFLVRAPKDLVWLPVSILGSSLIANATGWIVLWWKDFRPPITVHPSRWWEMMKPSLHYAATTMMATVYHRSGHLVVRWFLGDYALGLYAAAVRFVDILRNFIAIGLSVLMPRMALSANSGAGLKRLVRAAVSAIAGIGFPLALGTLMTAHLVVPFVLGASYAAAVNPVRWMAGLLLAAPVASLLSGTILYALGRHRSYLISGTAGAVTAVLFSLILVRPFGLPGACVALVLGEAAVAASAYFLIPDDLQDLWKNPFILAAGLSALLMAAAVRLANAYTSRPLLVVAAGVVVYSVALAAFGRRVLIQQLGASE